MSRVLTGSYILIAAGLTLGLAGCGSRARQTESTYRMGERMRVGNLIFTVLESQWRTSLGEMFSQRLPQQRFLLLRLTITNSGGQEISVPLLNLVDSRGNEFPELQNGEGVNGWLGLFRTIAPAQTADGWILFDVNPNSYSLRVTDASSPENEQSLLISIPLNLDSMGDAGSAILPAPQP